MLHIVASFDTEWDATERITSKKAASNAHAPLVASAIVL